MIDSNYEKEVNSASLTRLKGLLRMINVEKYPGRKELIEARIAVLEGKNPLDIYSDTSVQDEIKYENENERDYDPDYEEELTASDVLSFKYSINETKELVKNSSLIGLFLILLVPQSILSHLIDSSILTWNEVVQIGINLIWTGLWQIPIYLKISEIVNGQKHSSKFKLTLKKFIPLIIADLVFGFLVLLFSCLLIVPGILFSIASMFYKQMLILEDKNIKDSFTSSWEISKGYRWRLFGNIALLCLIEVVIIFVISSFTPDNSRKGFSFIYTLYMPIFNWVFIALQYFSLVDIQVTTNAE